MKKVLVFLIVIAVTAILTGCGGNTSTQEPANTQGGAGQAIPEVSGSTNEWCPVGSFVTTQEGSMKVTGLQDIVIHGTRIKTCCAEATTNEGKSKYCFNEDSSYSVYYIWKDGEWVKTMELYVSNGQQCMDMYNEEGVRTAHACS